MPIPGTDSEYAVHYTIITDNVTDTAATVYGSGLLPARYSVLEENVYASLRTFSVHQERNAPKVWRGVARYSAAPLSQQEEERRQTPNPIERFAEISWKTTPYESPALFTTDGRTICNSAGETPDQVPVKTDYFWTVTVQKNVPGIPWWVTDYEGVVNEDDFVIDDVPILKRHARLVDIQISNKMREGTDVYRQLSFTLELRPRRKYNGLDLPLPLEGVTSFYNVSARAAYPFELELPDMGLHKKAVGGARTKFMTDDSPPRPVAQPIPMDGTGDKLADPDPDNWLLSHWPIYETRDFSILPLT